MCSNFGFNHHPGRAPLALERSWYDLALRLGKWFRKLFRGPAVPLHWDH